MATATRKKKGEPVAETDTIAPEHVEVFNRATKLGIDVEPSRCEWIELGLLVSAIESWSQPVRTALKRAGVDPATLVTEQQLRAVDPPAGLRGKALAEFVLDGKGLAEQTPPREKKAETDEARMPRKGSALAAALVVLEGKPDGMKPPAILVEAKRRRLVPGLKGKTPEATLAAQLAVEAKKGRYVKRVAPATFALLDEAKP